MNRADLKEKWGKYCDTNVMVDEFLDLLCAWNYRRSVHGICKMLDTYFSNKEDLIKLFMKSDSYIGDMRIALDIELERQNDRYAIEHFCRHFLKNVGARKIIVKKVDENGKKLSDYIKTGVTKLTPKDLLNEEFIQKLKVNNANSIKFNDDGDLLSTVDIFDDLQHLFSCYFSSNSSSKLNESVVNYVNESNLTSKLAEGMKTSRAFNRVCTDYKIDTAKNYQKLFAEYADMVSDLKRKLKFFISLNPLDYLTMSNGINWSSCHNVMHHGGYCGGAMSYMLDHSSIITFVHDTIPTNIPNAGKIYRNMFHFQNDVLIQSRVYPQSNDGLTDLYKVFRGFVQDELAKLLGLENKTWVIRKEQCRANINHNGVQYPDYHYSNGCNASYPKEKDESKHNIVTIGHDRICTYCGETIGRNDMSSSYWHHYECDIPEVLTIEQRVDGIVANTSEIEDLINRLSDEILIEDLRVNIE